MDFSLPSSAFFGKIVPKNKILENFQKTGKSGITELRTELSDNIEKIIWKYKIAESTTGIRKTENILEIQIFEIFLKHKDIPTHILKNIDILITSPILYVLVYDNNYSYGISLKKSGVENSRHKYLFSGWNENMDFDFSALTTDILYENICKKFLEKEKNFGKNPENTQEKPKSENTNLQQTIEYRESKLKLKKEIESLESKLRREKSLPKRHEIFLQIQNKKIEYEKIF